MIRFNGYHTTFLAHQSTRNIGKCSIYTRLCARCQKTVYNLSAMTQAEAEAVLRAGLEAPPCVRFYRMADGRVRTTDRLPRLALTAGLAAAAAVALNSPARVEAPISIPLAAPATEAGQAGAEAGSGIAQQLPIAEIGAPTAAPVAPVAPVQAAGPESTIDEPFMGDYIE